MSINPHPPSKPQAGNRAARRSIGPALNALFIVGFVVAIALVGHQFSNSTAPAAPSMRGHSAPTLPLAVLRALRSGAGRTSAAPIRIVKSRAQPASLPAQIALQPAPASRPLSGQTVSSIKPADAPSSVAHARPVAVVCTAAMVGARREACLTERLRWANRQWRAEFHEASEAKPVQPRQRT